jgi:hypothetical protein
MKFLMSTSPPRTTELDDLQQEIKLKGDEIRQLKADGVDKQSLAPHIEELVALKAQLPQDLSAAAIKTKAEKPGKQTKELKKPNPNQRRPESEMTTSELRANRLAKVDAMRQAGVEPFDYSYQTTHTAMQLSNAYEGKLEAGQDDDESIKVAVAGRIMTKRVFGKLAFFTLQDESGLIQLQFDTNRLGDSFQASSILE